jgi:hypothetical protein
MTKRLTTEYRGVTLHYVKDHFGDRKEDLWEVWGDLDIRGNLRQCMDAIDKWEMTKKIAATILAEIAPLIRADEREDADRAYSLVEKAFKDGLRYANSVNVLDDADMDQAWQWSQVRAAAIRNRGNE